LTVKTVLGKIMGGWYRGCRQQSARGSKMDILNCFVFLHSTNFELLSLKRKLNK
jgi:hypothetical protein